MSRNVSENTAFCLPLAFPPPSFLHPEHVPGRRVTGLAEFEPTADSGFSSLLLNGGCRPFPLVLRKLLKKCIYKSELWKNYEWKALYIFLCLLYLQCCYI